MRRLVAAAFAVVGSTLVLATSALAGSSSSSHGYGGAAGSVQGQIQKGGTLPFTGFDLTMVVVFAVLLVAAGFGIRRLGQSRS